MSKPLVSVIILDFLKAQRVVKNVESILKQTGDFDLEIIIVDNSNNDSNASVLRPLEKHKEVQLIINSENEGYTKGNNTGAKYAKGDYMAIVNPDIIWKEASSFQKIISHLEKNPDIGIVGPRQINPDQSFAMTVRAFPHMFVQVARRTFLRNFPLVKSWVAYDEMRHLNYEKTQDVDWLQSSCFFLRKSLWNQLKGFDERYFLFMADTEMCLQAWKKGKRVVFFAETEVLADGVRCSDGGFMSFFKQWVLRQHLKDSLKYSFKHFLQRSPRKK